MRWGYDGLLQRFYPSFLTDPSIINVTIRTVPLLLLVL
jgi:hypothetical protein